MKKGGSCVPTKSDIQATPESISRKLIRQITSTDLYDWVKLGEKSIYAMSETELRERLTPQNPEWAMAAAEFSLAQYFHLGGNPQAAIPHYKEAQRLNPENWNFKRQAWMLTSADKEYGTSFTKEVQKLNGKPYYVPLKLPEVKK